MLTKFLSVFAFGMIGLWEGIPLGFVLHLPPIAIGLASALGSTAATLIVLFLGDGILTRLVRRRVLGGVVKRERLIDRAWRSYGLVGFGLLAPCLIGAPLGVATGLLLDAPPRRLVLWLIVGISLWSVLFTVAGAYGAARIHAMIAG